MNVMKAWWLFHRSALDRTTWDCQSGRLVGQRGAEHRPARSRSSEHHQHGCNSFFFFIINSHTAMTVSFIHTFFMQPCSAAILRFSAHHTVFLFPFQLRVARHRTGPGERLDITSLVNFVPSALRSRAVLHTFRSLSFSLCSWMFVILTEVITM